MSASDGRPPELCGLEISAVVRRYFKFSRVDEDTVKCLPSYSDRNYYFEGTTSNGKKEMFVLKIYNALYSSFSEIEGLNKLICILKAAGILHQVPEPSKAGPDVIQLQLSCQELDDYHLLSEDVSNGSGSNLTRNALGKKLPVASSLRDSTSYLISILSFVPGELFDNIDKKYVLPELLHEIGVKIALMDRELKNVRNEAIEARPNIDWNLLYFLDMRKLMPNFESASKAQKATVIFDAFEKHVAPKLPNLECSIIHGDMNGLNIVLQKNPTTDTYSYMSFIDFGDASKSCTIFELAIALTYIMAENLAPITCSNCVELSKPLIDGYTSVLPMSRDELDMLYYLVVARCCQSVINAEISFKKEPWNSYLLVSQGKCWALIDLLLKMTKENVDQVWF